MEEAVTAFLDVDTLKGVNMLSKEFHMDRSSIIKDLIREGLELKIRKRALELYTSRKISLQKAAEIMSISIWEMLDIVKREGIHLDYDMEELNEDLEPMLKQ